MKRIALLFALAASLAGCSQSTKLTNTWRAPDFQGGSFRKTLVIAVFERTGAREVVEGQFVEQIKDEGAEAAASHAFLSDEELSREAVVHKVREGGFDSVVLARLIDQAAFEKTYAPTAPSLDVDAARQQTWYHDYVASSAPRESGSYTVASRRDVRVETRVFDAKTEKLVWSGVSETKVDGEDPAQVADAVSAILSRLRKENLF